MTGLGTLPLRTLVVCLVGFLAVIAGYIALQLAGVDASGYVQLVITVGGLLGLGAHAEARTRAQNHQLDKITMQTNGVLEDRIRNGARKAVRETFREVGYPLAED